MAPYCRAQRREAEQVVRELKAWLRTQPPPMALRRSVATICVLWPAAPRVALADASCGEGLCLRVLRQLGPLLLRLHGAGRPPFFVHELHRFPLIFRAFRRFAAGFQGFGGQKKDDDHVSSHSHCRCRHGALLPISQQHLPRRREAPRTPSDPPLKIALEALFGRFPAQDPPVIAAERHLKGSSSFDKCRRLCLGAGGGLQLLAPGAPSAYARAGPLCCGPVAVGRHSLLGLHGAVLPARDGRGDLTSGAFQWHFSPVSQAL